MTKDELKVKLNEENAKIQDVRDAMNLKDKNGYACYAKLMEDIEKGKTSTSNVLEHMDEALVGLMDESLILTFAFYGKVKAINEFTGYDIPFATVMAQAEKSVNKVKGE